MPVNCELRPGLVCRHHTGRVYTVLGITNGGGEGTDRFPHTVVYVGANGAIWSRPAEQFLAKFDVLYDGTNLAKKPGTPPAPPGWTKGLDTAPRDRELVCRHPVWHCRALVRWTEYAEWQGWEMVGDYPDGAVDAVDVPDVEWIALPE